MTTRITEIDKFVAGRLRAARHVAGLSMENVAAILGLTFQQIQKYENGTNRVTAGKLALLAEAYSKPIGWFFEGVPSADRAAASVSDDITMQLLAAPYGVALARDYLAIQHNANRYVVASVANALAKGGA